MYVNFYEITWREILEVYSLDSRNHWNLKSHEELCDYEVKWCRLF
jgi:hypothetical protein